MLDFAGEYLWLVQLNRLQSWGFYSLHIIHDSADRFIAWGCIGKRAFLAYEITRMTNDAIRITPIDFIPGSFKVFKSLALVIWFILSVLLSQLAGKIFQANVCLNSKLYLAPFCNYLQNNLLGEEG